MTAADGWDNATPVATVDAAAGIAAGAGVVVAVMKATWNGTVIAETTDTVVVEGNHYFPTSSIKPEYLELSATTSVCPWKGTASYYSLTVDGATNTDAAWYYPAPKDAAKNITDRVAFWKGVVVSE